MGDINVVCGEARKGEFGPLTQWDRCRCAFRFAGVALYAYPQFVPEEGFDLSQRSKVWGWLKAVSLALGLQD